MKHILIPWRAGFIGSHLVHRLLSGGEWSITVVDDFQPISMTRDQSARMFVCISEVHCTNFTKWIFANGWRERGRGLEEV